MAGILTYKSAAHATFYKNYLINTAYRFDGKTLAALFLLTSTPDLWKRAKAAIKGKKVRFDKIDIHGISAYGYTLVVIARDLYQNTTHINLYDLADDFLISSNMFKLIMSAITVAREGYEAIGIVKRFW